MRTELESFDIRGNADRDWLAPFRVSMKQAGKCVYFLVWLICLICIWHTSAVVLIGLLLSGSWPAWYRERAQVGKRLNSGFAQ